MTMGLANDIPVLYAADGISEHYQSIGQQFERKKVTHARLL